MTAPASMRNPVLSARGLLKEYGSGAARVRAIRGVDLDVAAGESVAIIGPSGCGKSTLLYLLGGLERPTAGSLRLVDRRLERLPVDETRLSGGRARSLGAITGLEE